MNKNNIKYFYNKVLKKLQIYFLKFINKLIIKIFRIQILFNNFMEL